jgi:murein DD-endopeptidase MepM/ murein hydrolase activator NlpD
VAVLLDRAQQALGTELGKFRFPVKPPYSYVDTFGAPRMEGTKYAHRHEGNDIFALEGTPLVACVTGTVFGVGVAPLGGNKLWLRGPDGFTYYYAHLRGYAPAGRNGARVQAGTVLGYVGTTGNARGTPPHLHFEIHQPNGAAIDPYPTLRAAERAWSSI